VVHFLQESVSDGLAHDYEGFEQTEDMSISKYKTRFIELSKHAPHPIIEDICKVVRQRIKGITNFICGMAYLLNFAELSSLALQIEQQKFKGGSKQDSRKE
jgi:hypothetical protein